MTVLSSLSPVKRAYTVTLFLPVMHQALEYLLILTKNTWK